MDTQARILGTLAARRLPDEDIFDRTLRGDPVAFAEVYRRYQKRVYGFCLARSLDPGAAADASQEVFMRLLRAEPGSIDNPRGWLFTVARNVAIDAIRRRERTPEDPGVDDGEIAWDRLKSADTADEVLSRSDARNVFLALRRLNPRYRTALVMRAIHGQSAKDLALAFGTTPGAVDTLVSRARDAFGTAYASVIELPAPCRANVELIYRRHGTGITPQEQASLDAHLHDCAACRAEAKKADDPRHLSALLPFLVPAGRLGRGIVERAALTLRTVPDAAVQHAGPALLQPSTWNLASKIAAGALAAALVAAPLAAVESGRIGPAASATAKTPAVAASPASRGWMAGASWSAMWDGSRGTAAGGTGAPGCADGTGSQVPAGTYSCDRAGDLRAEVTAMRNGSWETMSGAETTSRHTATTSTDSHTSTGRTPTRHASGTSSHSGTTDSHTAPSGHSTVSHESGMSGEGGGSGGSGTPMGSGWDGR